MTFSANGRRPLFVPPGIQVVRTGPTTPVEFQRLFEEEQVERSGVRPIASVSPRHSGLLQAVADVLQLRSEKQRSRR